MKRGASSSPGSEREDIEELINIKKRYLHKLKKKQSRLGLSSPPELLMEVEDYEQAIDELESKLAT